MNKVNLLFSSAFEAKDAAYILQGKWDGCNSVLTLNDKAAIRVAAELLNIEFCYEGNVCHIKKSYEPQDLRRFEFSPVDFNPYNCF